MGANLAAAALTDPVLGAQSIFRGVLDAMAHPGSIVALDDMPPKIDRLAEATNGILLTLADATTPVWLAPALATDDTVAQLRFQCGGPPVAQPAKASFAVIDYEQFELQSVEATRRCPTGAITWVELAQFSDLHEEAPRELVPH